jgi:hypothetical protein
MIFIPSIFFYPSPHSSTFCTVPFSKAISAGWKTKIHWWKILFFHSIDIMIVNAFIVFQEFKKENPQKFDNLRSSFNLAWA